MTKLEKITAAAAKLTEQQLDGLLEQIEELATGPHYRALPTEVRASIDRALAERDAGEGASAAAVFARLQRKIDGAR